MNRSGLLDDLLIALAYLVLLSACVIARDWLNLALTVLLLTVPAFLRVLRLWERWLDRPRRRKDHILRKLEPGTRR